MRGVASQYRLARILIAWHGALKRAIDGRVRIQGRSCFPGAPPTRMTGAPDCQRRWRLRRTSIMWAFWRGEFQYLSYCRWAGNAIREIRERSLSGCALRTWMYARSINRILPIATAVSRRRQQVNSIACRLPTGADVLAEEVSGQVDAGTDRRPAASPPDCERGRARRAVLVAKLPSHDAILGAVSACTCAPRANSGRDRRKRSAAPTGPSVPLLANGARRQRPGCRQSQTGRPRANDRVDPDGTSRCWRRVAMGSAADTWWPQDNVASEARRHSDTIARLRGHLVQQSTALAQKDESMADLHALYSKLQGGRGVCLRASLHVTDRRSRQMKSTG